MQMTSTIAPRTTSKLRTVVNKFAPIASNRQRIAVILKPFGAVTPTLVSPLETNEESDGPQMRLFVIVAYVVDVWRLELKSKTYFLEVDLQYQ